MLDTMFKVFKWAPSFTSQPESPIVHRWVRQPQISSNLCAPSVFERISNSITKFINADENTVNKSNSAYARICELGLTVPLPRRV